MGVNHVITLPVPLWVANQVALDPQVDDALIYEAEPSSNLHVTLAFLGKNPGATAVTILSAIRVVTERYAPIPAEISTPLQRFAYPKRHVIWARVTVHRQLQAMRDHLVANLEAIGAKVDDTYDADGWTPHVTVARVAPTWREPQRGAFAAAMSFDVVRYKAAGVTHDLSFVGDDR